MTGISFPLPDPECCFGHPASNLADFVFLLRNSPVCSDGHSGAIFGTLTFGTMTFGTRTFGTMTFGTMTFGTITFGTMTFATVTFGTMTFGTMTLGTMTFGTMTLGTLTFGTLPDAHFLHPEFPGVGTFTLTPYV